jgi:hypothetical protein
MGKKYAFGVTVKLPRKTAKKGANSYTNVMFAVVNF